MIQILCSDHHDIFKNVAIERYLFENAQDDLILFLWSNEPCVVFGRNQNIYKEINLDYAKKHDIKVIRRFSGGGAVYQDLGNLNYTFICKDDYDLDKINDILIKVFANLGLAVTFSGRNDLLVNGKKFSGIAYCHDFDHIMYHGTCLIDTSIDRLTEVLIPHDYKLVTHSISSYRSRVTNLKDIKDINEIDIINSFINTLGTLDEINVNQTIAINQDIQAIIDQLSDVNYIYNDCPSFTYEFDIKLNKANYTLKLDYRDGVIQDLSVYSDDLDINQINFYKDKLKGQKIPIEQLSNYLNNL